MPRLLLLNNVLLFFCCSLLMGAGASSLYFHVPLEPLPGFDQALSILAIVMLVTGLAMTLTEWFTGIRWVPPWWSCSRSPAGSRCPCLNLPLRRARAIFQGRALGGLAYGWR